MLKLGKTTKNPSFGFDNSDKLKYQDTDISVYRAIVDANEDYMDDTALIFMGNKISYRQLIAQADKVSDIMTSLNIRKGEMILLGANSPQAVSILLACSKIGVGAMILSERTRAEVFAQMVSDIDIPLMFCTSDMYIKFSENSAVDELAQVVILPADTPIGQDESNDNYSQKSSNVCSWDVFLNYKITEYAEEVNGGYFPLTISASTGSTGAPKGIVLENKSYIALYKMIYHSEIDWHRGDILAATLSTGVATGISLLIFVPLMMGLTILQHPRHPEVNPFTSFFDNAALYKANILVSPPSLWIAMITSHPKSVDLSSVRRTYTIGESISEAEYNIINNFLKENNAQDYLRNMYGMSEVNSIATYAPDSLKNNLSAGKALPYNLISIFDSDTLEEKKFGEKGEVFIYTPTVMREYIYDPKETKKTFERDNLGRRWIRTGDLGVVNEDGELTILGRISQRYISADGIIVYPYMLEKIISGIPEISRFKMVNTTYNGKAIYAIHLIPSDLTADKNKLANKLYDALSNCGDISILPGLIKVRESFPKNPGGKVDMQKLAQEKDGFFVINK